MTKNLARLIAGPVVAAGMAAGALGFAAAANADDAVGVAADLWSPHTGPIIASGPNYRPGEHYRIPGGIDNPDLSTAHHMR
jgi:hypothetical protein